MTIRVLDIIHRPVFYLKHDISETGLCPEEETRSMYGSQLRRFLQKTATESSLRNVEFEIKGRKMDNILN
jgi:hypothetical protein